LRAIVRRSAQQASETWSLGLLERSPDTVVSKEKLSQRVSSFGEPIDTAVIEVHVCNLRKKIGADRVHTIRGVGYLSSLTKTGNDRCGGDRRHTRHLWRVVHWLVRHRPRLRTATSRSTPRALEPDTLHLRSRHGLDYSGSWATRATVLSSIRAMSMPVRPRVSPQPRHDCGPWRTTSVWGAAASGGLPIESHALAGFAPAGRNGMATEYHNSSAKSQPRAFQQRCSRMNCMRRRRTGSRQG
jgi:hypothetical protein